MNAKSFQIFRRDRRAATALIICIMVIPMIISCGAAVDFSRVAAARAQMQAAVDTAAVAGVGAYQTDEQGTSAYSVAYNSFKATSATVSSYATISSTVVATGCSGTTGTGSQCGTPSATTITCGTASDYCVQVTATATLTNSLLASWIPSDVLTVSALANTGTVITSQNFPSQNIPNAYDNNATYVYPVPMTSPGNKPNYSQLPYVSNSCIGPITNGVLASALPPDTSTSTTCQYFEIGSSTGTSSTPQTPLAVGRKQPVAFLFVNVTGNTTGYNYVPVGTSSGAVGTSSDGAGFCPNWTLYGSISYEPLQSPYGVPVQDSTHIYSSAYEAEGLPPTYSSSPADEALSTDPKGINQPYGTNQPITQFTIPAGTNVGPQNIIAGYPNITIYTNGTSVSLRFRAGYTAETLSNDPTQILYYQNGSNYSTIGGTGYAPVYGNGTATINSYNGAGFTTTADFTCPAQPGWNASYYPSNPYYSSSSVTPITRPQVVSGCTPTSSGTWNYSTSNLGNCSNGGQLPRSGGVTPPAGQQSTAFNNCALLIEDLGPNLTTLSPYLTTAQKSAFGALPNPPTLPLSYRETTDSLSRSILVPNYSHYSGTKYQPPAATSYQCYNPSTAYTAGTGFDTSSTSYDPIENPADGAIICQPLASGQTVPETYALYWNDMGSEESDDLGYSNAITLFTCSIPGGGGGPATLSG